MNHPGRRRLVILALGAALAVVVLGLAWGPSAPTEPAMLSGHVVDVLGGETFVLLVGATRHEIHLAGIDAPDASRPLGLQAKQALSQMALKRPVTVELLDAGPSDSNRAVAWLDGRCLNAELIRQGYARHAADRFASESLAAAEQEARSQGRGLWARSASAPPSATPSRYWLNTQTGVRHNARCRHYGHTKSGRPCRADEGRPCRECGG